MRKIGSYFGTSPIEYEGKSRVDVDLPALEAMGDRLSKNTDNLKSGVDDYLTA
jgi:hypothetical protein